ncbi:choice-of-anchor tandem repeat NxxGxxAF-containing protein [Saccharospirillum impatiens]|uniref:choice-of-anchor tandem repeat NxxGxxAF-containing protein n=1 Tax=Saccharospirillum impatiens TaxID=169438 RepID=UPI0004045CBD|nr:choice-of-anchor tandem repeat NxxGxxAF-containing protein [Saccharospirillum impatiens]
MDITRLIPPKYLRQGLISLMIAPALLLSGCGSSSDDGPGETDDTEDTSDSDQDPVDSLTAPTVSVNYDNWRLHFSWPEVAGADYYRLFEDPDSMTGYTQLGPDMTSNEYVYNINLSEGTDARFIVEACDSEQCLDSSEVTLDAVSSGITPIAFSGDTAPGMGGAVFSSDFGTSFDFDVNDQGVVALLGVTNQTDSSGSARDGVFTYESGSGLTLVQADDATLPESDASYNGFYDVWIANSGSILFGGLLNLDNTLTDDVDGFNNEVLLRNTSGTTALLAREGEPARNGTTFPTLDAGASVYFSENITTNRVFTNISINASGGISFQLGSNTDAFRSDDDSTFTDPTIWSIKEDGTKLQSLSANQTELPGSLDIASFSAFKQYSQNAAGQLAYGLALASLPNTTNSGVYVRDTDGSITEAAREAGGSASDYIDRLQAATVKITDNGEIFYFTQRNVAGVGNRGLYTNATGTTNTRIARIGLPFLLENGTTQEITGFIGGGRSFSASDDAAAFLVNAGLTDTEDALIVWQNGSAKRRFQEGDPVRALLDSSTVDLDLVSVPGTGPRIEMNDSGWIGFQGLTALGTEALFASSPNGYTRLIVREGQPFSVDGTAYGTVMEVLDFQIDNAATLTVGLRFVGGTNGIFSFTLCGADEPC